MFPLCKLVCNECFCNCTKLVRWFVSCHEELRMYTRMPRQTTGLVTRSRIKTVGGSKLLISCLSDSYYGSCGFIFSTGTGKQGRTLRCLSSKGLQELNVQILEYTRNSCCLFKLFFSCPCAILAQY